MDFYFINVGYKYGIEENKIYDTTKAICIKQRMLFILFLAIFVLNIAILIWYLVVVNMKIFCCQHYININVRLYSLTLNVMF